MAQKVGQLQVQKAKEEQKAQQMTKAQQHLEDAAVAAQLGKPSVAAPSNISHAGTWTPQSRCSPLWLRERVCNYVVPWTFADPPERAYAHWASKCVCATICV